MTMFYKMFPCRVRTTNGKDILFTGSLLAEAVIDRHNEKQRLALYRTKSGHFVAETLTWAKRLGTMGKCEGKVCMNAEEVRAFLGHQSEAVEMYKKVGFL
ncbi:MAG: hypothetical protein KF908_14890 [Nitrosomonas sp.]|nr:hypothetical protein [Nitrosomonas sp.]MCW5607787.1 hypothetical protein [Nitrosomonas sp.]